MTPILHQKSPRILSFGEILWDVVQEKEYIGGAPFNLAAHVVRSGLQADFYSRVGVDDRGRRAQLELEHLGVNTRWLQHDPHAETGWVGVDLDDKGQAEYFFPEAIAWDAIESPSNAKSNELKNSGYAAFCFGTLAQRTPKSSEALKSIRTALQGVPIFYDVNFRAPHTTLEMVISTLPGTTLVKVNEAEAHLLADYFNESDWPRLFSRLQAAYGTQVLIVTRGGEGCWVADQKTIADLPGESIRVASTVGAGDAFSAAFLATWLQGQGIEQAARKANRYGAWVASCPEAIPDILAQE